MGVGARSWSSSIDEIGWSFCFGVEYDLKETSLFSASASSLASSSSATYWLDEGL
jgi:hypothetical protein